MSHFQPYCNFLNNKEIETNLTSKLPCDVKIFIARATLEYRYWSDTKPNIYTEKSNHAEKITVWAALSTNGIIGPLYFEDIDGNTETINSERYLTLLKHKLLPELRRRGVDVTQVWFQQDGDTPHTAHHVLKWLTKTFASRIVSLKTDIAWPPDSPNLSPLDFFLRGVQSKADTKR